MAQKPLFLQVYKSEKLIISKQFLLDQISIGSQTDGPNLVIEDELISPWHALIEKRDEEYYIIDLGSPTGTFVNSKPTLESIIKHGDKIQIGDVVIKVIDMTTAMSAKKDISKSTAAISAKKDILKSTAAISAKKDISKSTAAMSAKKTHTTDTVDIPEFTNKIDIKPTITKTEFTKKESIKKESIKKDSAKKVNVSEYPKTEIIFNKKSNVESSSESYIESNVESKPSAEPVYESQSSDAESSSESHIESNVESKPSAEPVYESQSSDVKSNAKSKPSAEPVYESQSSDAESNSESKSVQEVATSIQTNMPLNQKGTYAPKSVIQNLEKELSPGVGSVVEVIVSWKERILFIDYFKKSDSKITFGSDTKSDICCPNLIGNFKYNLLDIKNDISVLLSNGVKASTIDKSGKKYSFNNLLDEGIIKNEGACQKIILDQNQVICLDFSSLLSVYIRYSQKMQKITSVKFFNFTWAESIGIMMSFVCMFILFAYVMFFSDNLDPTKDLKLEKTNKASITFVKKNRVVKLRLIKKPKKQKIKIVKKIVKTVRKKRIFKSPIKKLKSQKNYFVKNKIKKPKKFIKRATPKPKKSKKLNTISVKSANRISKKKFIKKVQIPRPDPSKIGLLGLIKKTGVKKVLDKAYSGSEELAGLANTVTDVENKNSPNKGIGSMFKDIGSGGKGASLIGVSSNIKTKGKAGGSRGGGHQVKSLGGRGVVKLLEIDSDDIYEEGGIDKDAILRVIRRNKQQLEHCYEIALQKKPNLEGKVVIKWQIVNDRVKKARVKSNTTRDRVLGQCLVSRLTRFRFTGVGLQRGQIGEVSMPFVVTKK